MNIVTLHSFHLIGIVVRTTNENGQSGIDIPELWKQFWSKNILSAITNRIDNSVYSVYSDYEKDYTKPYTTMLGCRVDNLDAIPEGLTGKTFPGGSYQVFNVKGRLSDNIVFQEWQKIWTSDIERAYTADFEVYGDKAQNPDNAEVDIFVAV